MQSGRGGTLSPAADSSESWGGGGGKSVENCFPFCSLKCVCIVKLYFEKTSCKMGKITHHCLANSVHRGAAPWLLKGFRTQHLAGSSCAPAAGLWVQPGWPLGRQVKSRTRAPREGQNAAALDKFSPA